jgi:hypothetical protein
MCTQIDCPSLPQNYPAIVPEPDLDRIRSETGVKVKRVDQSVLYSDYAWGLI